MSILLSRYLLFRLRGWEGSVVNQSIQLLGLYNGIESRNATQTLYISNPLLIV
ncbi:MAG: hypothetical protein RLZZ148_925 [Cyanobacteriota bacterium]